MPIAIETKGALAAAAAALLLNGCAKTEAQDKPPADTRPHVVAANPIEAGRYLVRVGGCNDCHTKDWDVTAGAVPEDKWLMGTGLGWQGPWGTTYPANLRLTVQNVTEDDFVTMLHTRKDKPPMPWMNVAVMHESDARAVYAFIKSLGPAGEPAPPPAAPGETPKTPYIVVAPPIMPAAN